MPKGGLAKKTQLGDGQRKLLGWMVGQPLHTCGGACYVMCVLLHCRVCQKVRLVSHCGLCQQLIVLAAVLVTEPLQDKDN